MPWACHNPGVAGSRAATLGPTHRPDAHATNTVNTSTQALNTRTPNCTGTAYKTVDRSRTGREQGSQAQRVLSRYEAGRQPSSSLAAPAPAHPCKDSGRRSRISSRDSEEGRHPHDGLARRMAPEGREAMTGAEWV